MTPAADRFFPAARRRSTAAPMLSPWTGHEAGRARSVRRRPPTSARGGLSAGRVRRTGELHARERDPRRWRIRPASSRGRRCSTCAAESRGRDGSSPASAWLQPTSGWTTAPARSNWRGSAPACFRAGSRSRASPRSRPDPFDVVMLLETMLAFPEKAPLLREISGRWPLAGGSRSPWKRACPSPSPSERPCRTADTVWLIPLPEMLSCLERAGLVVRWQEDWSRPHRAMADSLLDAFAGDAQDDRRADRAPGHWRSCSRPTGYGATGSGKGASASSRSSRRRRDAADLRHDA